MVIPAATTERNVKEVHFPEGSSSAVIKGSIQGYSYVYHQLRAAAGETINASLQTANGANYFKVLPPGSFNVAMYNASTNSALRNSLARRRRVLFTR